MAVAAFAVAWPAVFGVRPRRGIAAFLLVAALVLQLQIEGPRWQMIPVYLLAVGLAVGDILFVERTLPWSNRLARGVFGMAGVALATSLALALPIPTLPRPSGPEAIGTFTVDLMDREREELYGDRPGGPRRFVAQVWYPAAPVEEGEAEGRARVRWSEDWEVVTSALAARMRLPSWFWGHTGYTLSHATEDLPVAEGIYPVVIYSHGWTGFRTDAINQIESLASNGYIVIAPDHTYGSAATVLSEDRVVPHDPEALPDPDEVGRDAYLAAGANLMATFAGDIITILDALDLGQAGPFQPLIASADLDRVGIYGHGAGGGAAVMVCIVDERCSAVLGLDPWVEPLPDQVIRNDATRPALYIRSEGWQGTRNDALLRGIAARSEAVTYWLGIEGAEHNDLLATPLLTPMASQLGLRGSIPAGRILTIIDNYLLGFFGVFLLDTGTAALEAVTFPEVSVEVMSP